MKRNFWPYAIIAYFAVFITGVVIWVVFAVHHEDQLVRPDYYEHEMRFQQHLDRVTRTRALATDVQIDYHPKDQTVSIALPHGQTDKTTNGSIQLYRPSDARLDKLITFSPDERGTQTISVAGFQSGLWKVRLSWNSGENDYYFDQALVLTN